MESPLNVSRFGVKRLSKRLKVGDEVIKIIETTASDKPIKKYRSDPEKEKQRRRYYEHCNREFEAE